MSIYVGKKKAFALVILALGAALSASCSGANTKMSGPEETAEGSAAALAIQAEQPASGSDEPFRSYLLASVPEQRIYLFAEENGVTLHAGDLSREYAWGYMTPQGIEPVLHVADFDGDGKDELAVILYIGSGTGVSVDELHVVELDDLRDYPLLEEEYRPQVDQAIAGLKSSSAIPARYADQKISFGNWISYEKTEAGLRMSIGAGTVTQDDPMPDYIGELIADVNYRDGKYALTAFRFEEDEQAAEAEASSPATGALAEPGVNNESAESPDGKYLAEAYGVNKGVTAGGLYPAEGIRLVQISTGKELWSTMGYYSHSFVWSPNSRYAAVTYEARIWGGTVEVDARDGSEIALPDLESLRKQWEGETTVHEERPDPLFRSEEWLDDRRLRVSFQWTGADDETYSGEYVYDVPASKLLEVRPNAER